MSVPDFSNDYIVRIYRFDKKNPRHLVGVVEEVGVKEKKSFVNYDELWEILNKTKSVKSRVQGKKETQPHLNPKT